MKYLRSGGMQTAGRSGGGDNVGTHAPQEGRTAQGTSDKETPQSSRPISDAIGDSGARPGRLELHRWRGLGPGPYARRRGSPQAEVSGIRAETTSHEPRVAA